MADFEYVSPLSIANALAHEDDVKEFLEYLVGSVFLKAEEAESDDFIPPIVYNGMGKVFNVDYNFMVDCLSGWLDNIVVSDDFKLVENGGIKAQKAALFLVAGVLEEYHEVVRLNSKTYDLTRYNNAKKIDVSKRFYNTLLIKNGGNIKRFGAVPFAEVALRKYLSESVFVRLSEIANRGEFIQVAFGMKQLESYLKAGNPVPEYVFPVWG